MILASDYIKHMSGYSMVIFETIYGTALITCAMKIDLDVSDFAMIIKYISIRYYHNKRLWHT